MLALAALLLSTAVAAPAPKPQVLVLDLDAVGVDKAEVTILNGRIASLLAGRGDLEATTAGDIRAMAKLQANKADLGCDESSCLAELANALGARYVLYGRVGKLDDVFLLQLSLFDATVGKPVSRQEAQGDKLGALSSAMPGVLSELLRPLGGAPVDEGTPALVWTGAGLAGAGALAGLGLGAWALALNGDLTSTTASLPQKQFAYDNGLWVTGGAIAGAVVAGVGLAVAGAGLLP